MGVWTTPSGSAARSASISAGSVKFRTFSPASPPSSCRPTDELAWWTQDIITWCALEEALEVFFNSLEYVGEPRTLADHVTVLYRALLAREPDAGGLAWWVTDLAGQLATLEDEIMASQEFEARVYSLFP
jgi:hypothetical protein